MGTSSSSGGPRGSAPLLPPGVPPLPPPLPQQPAGEEPTPDQQGTQPATAPPVISPTQLAPPRRFMSSRTRLGQFAKTGSTEDLKRGLGHYAKTGLSGARAATQRMGRTVATA